MDYILILIVLGVIALAGFQLFRMFMFQRRGKFGVETGAIRFTGKDGRNMRIVRNEEGAFRMEEEERSGNRPC